MHIQIDPVLLLVQSLLCQPQIIADIVLGQEPFRLGLVIVFGGRQERLLEVFPVDFDVRLVVLAAMMLFVL
jgi:hypothetical protein